jgi:hypothetical protein
LAVEIAEIASQLRRSWGEKKIVRRGVVPKPLVGEIEEALIAAVVVLQNNRPNDGSAKLVLLKRNLYWDEIVGGIENIVAEKFPDIAMQLVASRLGDYVYDPAQDLSELCFVIVGLQLELLDVVERRLHGISIANRAIVIDPIQQKHIAAVVLAIDRGEDDGPQVITDPSPASIPRSIGGTHSRSEQQKLREIASI